MIQSRTNHRGQQVRSCTACGCIWILQTDGEWHYAGGRFRVHGDSWKRVFFRFPCNCQANGLEKEHIYTPSNN